MGGIPFFREPAGMWVRNCLQGRKVAIRAFHGTRWTWHPLGKAVLRKRQSDAWDQRCA